MAGFIRRVAIFHRPFLLWPLFYVTVAAIALGANPIKETVGPFDLLAAQPGFGAKVGAGGIRHGERSDVLDSLLPRWTEARKQIRDGRLPWWNPVAAGGEPLLLLPTNALLTPAFAVFAATPDPALGFYLSVLLNLSLAGLGAHLLAARRCHPTAAAFAGITFMLSGFVAAWLYWPHVLTALWIPWLLLAIDRYGEKLTYRRFLAVALTTALLFLGGFPFVVALGLGAAALWILMLCATRDDQALSFALGAFAGIALGLAIVAIPIVSLADWLAATDISYRTGGTPLRLSRDYMLLVLHFIDRPRVELTMYAGAAGILLALGALLVLRRKGNAVDLAALGLMLIAIGIVLSFGLLPHSVTSVLPVLKNNPWSRAIVLIDLGVALAAAAALNAIVRTVSFRPLGVAIAVVLTATQAFDLATLFSRFNGPTPRSYFYPPTPQIARLRSVLEPWQYAIADGNYLISGTLGPYGIPEWYAHGMRSPALKAALSGMAQDALPTPTSSRLRYGNIRWESPLIDAFAICYALSDGLAPIGRVVMRGDGRQRRPGPHLSRGLLEQTFSISGQPMEMSAMTLRLATYMHSDLDGLVTLGLYRDGGGTKPLAEVQTPADGIRDNQFHAFVFPRAIFLPPGGYRLTLEYAPGKKNLPLTVWTFAQPALRGRLIFDGKPLPGGMEFEAYGPSPEGAQSPTLMMQGGGSTLLANTSCARGPYLSAGERTPAPQRSLGSVDVLSYRTDSFVIESSTARPAYLIVPMRWTDEWTARVNGKPAQVGLGYGVMPAVKVEGRGRVRFDYRPRALRVGGIISLAALALIAAFAAWHRIDARQPRREEVSHI